MPTVEIDGPRENPCRARVFGKSNKQWRVVVTTRSRSTLKWKHSWHKHCFEACSRGPRFGRLRWRRTSDHHPILRLPQTRGNYCRTSFEIRATWGAYYRTRHKIRGHFQAFSAFSMSSPREVHLENRYVHDLECLLLRESIEVIVNKAIVEHLYKNHHDCGCKKPSILVSSGFCFIHAYINRYERVFLLNF